jgi:hypothetical protein
MTFLGLLSQSVAELTQRRAARAVLESIAKADAERRAARCGTLATLEDFKNVPRLRGQSGE